MYFSILLLIVISSILYKLSKKRRNNYRTQHIDHYSFPTAIINKVQQHYPQLTDMQLQQVTTALRDYFHLCHSAGKRNVSMPSQVVDIAWHEFILFTRQYHDFCQQAFGRFLHHTPAEAMQSPTIAQKGIKTAWKLACQRENINNKTPHKLPLLFAIDGLLQIKDGFRYNLDCQTATSTGFCASHIGCSSHSGCSGGDGNNDTSSCSSGCGGGD